MPDWYYAKEGQQFGPISPAQLKQMASTGQIQPHDLVFQEGGTNWVEASTVKGLFAAASASAPAPAPVTNQPAATTRRKAEPPPGSLDFDEGDEIKPRGMRESSDGGSFNDLLMFRSFITPWVMIIIFWVGVVAVLLSCMFIAWQGITFMQYSAMMGVLYLLGALIAFPIGVINWRIACELTILAFRMYDKLVQIHAQLKKNSR